MYPLRRNLPNLLPESADAISCRSSTFVECIPLRGCVSVGDRAFVRGDPVGVGFASRRKTTADSGSSVESIPCLYPSYSENDSLPVRRPVLLLSERRQNQDPLTNETLQSKLICSMLSNALHRSLRNWCQTPYTSQLSYVQTEQIEGCNSRLVLRCR